MIYPEKSQFVRYSGNIWKNLILKPHKVIKMSGYGKQQDSLWVVFSRSCSGLELIISNIDGENGCLFLLMSCKSQNLMNGHIKVARASACDDNIFESLLRNVILFSIATFKALSLRKERMCCQQLEGCRSLLRWKMAAG